MGTTANQPITIMSTGNSTEAYRKRNRFILIALLACLAWPFAVWLLTSLFPYALQTCSSLRFFNRPCPMCGLTRGFLDLVRGNPAGAHAYNPLTLPLSILLMLEIIFRASISSKSKAQRLPTSLPRIDARIHILLVVVYLVYSVIFLLRTW